MRSLELESSYIQFKKALKYDKVYINLDSNKAIYDGTKTRKI